MSDWNHEDNQQLSLFIGQALKTYRLQKNLTQAELAQASGISKPSLVRLESGHGNLSLHNFLSVIKALGIANELQPVFNKLNQLSPRLMVQAESSRPQRVKKTTAKNPPKKWAWGDDKP